MKNIYITTLLFLYSITSLAQWTSNTSLNLEVAGTNVADLQTATTSDGKTWIAFYTNKGGNYDMRAQLLDAGGNKLLGPDGVLVSNQTSGSATFVFNVCLDASDNLIIAFQYQVTGNNTAVITKVNTDGSLPWGTTGIQLGAGLAPYPAVLTTGETVVAWNNNSPSTLYIQKISSSGTISWGAPIAVTVGASLTTRGQLVANPGGYFTMVFQRKSFGIATTLFAQRYNNDGVAQWASPTQISTLTTSGARYYSIVVDADITYFGFYASSGSRFFSYVQKINADGTIPWGENGALFSTYSTGADPYQQTTNIVHNNGSPYIWAVCTYTNTLQSQDGVFVQKFDASTGAVLLNPLGKEVYPISPNSDIQAGKLTLAGDEPIFMSYDVNYKIYATRLNSSGDFVWPGNRTELSSTTAGGSTPKGRFAFTDFVNNQVVAVWYENRGSEYRAYAQQVNGFGVIPLKFGDFNAYKKGRTVEISWNTITESNNKGFSIERSSDGVNYHEINFVNSKANTGNSSVNIDYSFTDLQPLLSYNYYRLKQVDLDSKFTYSKTILVRFDKQGNLVINSIYPTPASSILHVNMESVSGSKGTLSLIDMNGKVVQKHTFVFNKGNNIFNIDISSLSKGVYLINISGEGNINLTEKWTKE